MSILTLSTRINSYTSIQRTRLLPSMGEVLVRVGQDVNPVQVIARANARGGYYVLRAGDILGEPPEEIFRYLLVEPGAKLRKGTPILRKPGRFGRSKVFKSPVNGVLIDNRNGSLIIQATRDSFDLRAMIHGRVTSIIAGRGVVIETRGALVQAQWDSGKDGFGKLNTVVKSAKEPLNSDKISGDAHGTVLIVGWISSPDDLYRLENSGIRGVIAGSMPAKICMMAATLSFPIFLTDGIGEQAMTEPIFQILHRSENKNASLLTSRNSFKGQRSEIIIPTVSAQAESPFRFRPLDNGDLVRVFRWDGGNQIGRVSSVDARPRYSSVGILESGAEIEFGSGDKAFIPFTNLDLIS